MMLRYTTVGPDIFTKSTGIFRYFYKKYRRKSIAIQMCPVLVWRALLGEISVKELNTYSLLFNTI